MNFKRQFFKYYDERVCSGDISFSSTGISKELFTAICTEVDFVPSEEDLMIISKGLRLNEDEFNELKTSLKK